MRDIIATVVASAIFSIGFTQAVFAEDGAAKVKATKGDNQKEGKCDGVRKKKHDDANADADADSLRKKKRADGDNSVDRRQDRQAKRIEQGVKNGSLTPDELKKLQDQQKNISTIESSLKADGNLSKDDVKRLQSALNEASRNIWTEKHDADGKKTTVERLGKDVSLNSALSAKLTAGNLSGADAKTLLTDFNRITEIKRSLASENLGDAQRVKTQSEYDTLLNKYFEGK